MALTTAGKTLALGPLSATTMSLHTGVAGNTGATNEASGGGYARKSCAFAAESGGSRALAASVLFDVGAAIYTHYALWIGASCIDTGALTSPKDLSAGAGQVNITTGSISI